jgi:hypothetical protein
MGRPLIELIEAVREAIPLNREFYDVAKTNLLQVEKVWVVYGAPGSGKTRFLVDLLNSGVLPRPISVVVFNRSVKRYIEGKAGDADCIDIKTIDGYAVRHVGFENMVNMNGDIEEGVETLRFSVSRIAKLPYSRDPYITLDGNALFEGLDYAVNKGGREGIKAYVDLLDEAYDGLGVVPELYLACLQGRIRRLGPLECSGPAYDFTLARLELYGSRAPVMHGCGRVRTVIVDEVQDLSPLMWGIIGHWAADLEAMVFAGDVDQTVYRNLHFADPEIPRWLYNEALKGRGSWTLKKLTSSYRVAEGIDRLAIDLLDAIDDEPSPWRTWEGVRGRHGMVYIETVEEGVVEILADYARDEELRWGERSYAILTATNDLVLDLTATLLQVCAGESEGSLPCVIPHFLKGVPSFIMRAINMANDVLMNRLDVTQATLEGLGITEDMVYSVAAILKYVGHRLEDYRRVNPWMGIDEAMRNVFDRELDPKHLVYHNNPKAPVFIDTIYTSKGLEFDRVYVVNFVREGARVPRDKWGAKLFYVGLTRSRGPVVILTTNKEGYIEWFPTKRITELARKVGTEVVEK